MLRSFYCFLEHSLNLFVKRVFLQRLKDLQTLSNMVHTSARSPGHHDPGHGDGAVPHVQGVAHLALRHVLRAALQPALGYRG